VGVAHLPGRQQPRKRRLRFIVSTKNREPTSHCVPPGIDPSAAFAAQSGSGLAILRSRRFVWQDIKDGKRCRGLARVSSVAASRLASSAGRHQDLEPEAPGCKPSAASRPRAVI